MRIEGLRVLVLAVALGVPRAGLATAGCAALHDAHPPHEHAMVDHGAHDAAGAHADIDDMDHRAAPGPDRQGDPPACDDCRVACLCDLHCAGASPMCSLDDAIVARPSPSRPIGPPIGRPSEPYLGQLLHPPQRA